VDIFWFYTEACFPVFLTCKRTYVYSHGTHNSSSSVSSSSSSTGGGGEGFPVGPLFLVDALPNGKARGGGGPPLEVAGSDVGCATVEVDFNVSDAPSLGPLSETSSSDAVSSSDPRSGVAGPGMSSLPICSSCLASSISILSLSDSSLCATFAALVGALRLEDRDGPALRGVSVLAVCIAFASRR
jgi:hypothetical protein